MWALFSRNKTAWLFLLVLVIAFAVSSVALDDTFLSDEFEFIYAAANVHNWQSFWQVITSKIGGDFYRPVAYFSFMVDYWLYGLGAWGYHLTNSFLHALNSLLVSLLVWRFGRMYLTSTDENKKSKLLFVSVVAGLLFAVFPNHHEAVTWLAARPDVLATTFYLATLLLWLHYLKQTTSQQPLKLTKRISLVAATCLVSALAYFTKEVSVSLIIVLTITAVWHLWFFRRDGFKKIGRPILFAWLLFVLIFISYIIIRRQLVGYWFGGYMLTGTSEFTSLNFSDIKNWLLAPVNMIFYSLNHSYLHHVASIRAPHVLTSSLGQNYLSWFKIAAYSLAAIVTAMALVVITRRRWWPVAVPVTLATLFFLYVTVAPALGLLNTINTALESTRYFYLPSVGLCILIALWLALWKNKWRTGLTTILVVGLAAVYLFNYQPWSLASASSASIQKAVENRSGSLQKGEWIYVLNTPDNLFGAYVFRRGLTHMFNLIQPNVSLDHVITSGRGVAGTYTPTCLLTQSDTFWLMQLDDATGRVQSFESQTAPTVQPTKDIEIKGQTLELHNLKQLDGDAYAVTGPQPFFVLKNVAVNPQEIAALKMTLVPEHDYPWEQQHLYWTTVSKPGYHEYYRHIWRFFGVSPDKKKSQAQVIPVCRYPAFVFSDTIQDIKITLPFKVGETFTLP